MDLFSYGNRLSPSNPHAPSTTAKTWLIDAAEAFAALLRQGTPIHYTTLNRTMQEVTGAPEGDGIWDIRDAYDTAEAGLAIVLRRHSVGLRPSSRLADEILTELDRYLSLMPLQARRAERTLALQQFSTPPTIGWLAARALRMRAGELVLEPSAGTGMLAIHALNDSAHLALNEISADRGRLVSYVTHLPVTHHDARYIDSLLAPTRRPTGVLMNPPFSRDINDHAGRDQSTARGHVSAALRHMLPGGRLVALVGATQGVHEDAAEWWAVLRDRATLVADIGIDGSFYHRFGTDWGCRLIVIDKDGGSGRLREPGPTPDSLLGLLDLIDAIPDRAPSSRTAIADLATGTPPSRPVVTQALQADQPPLLPTPAPAGKRKSRNAPYPGFTLPADTERATYDVVTPDLTWSGEALYMPYRPSRIRFHTAMAHPSALWESSAMAAIAMPAPRHVPVVSRGDLERGIATEPQLEVMVYANEAWSQTVTYADEEKNPITARRGLMLGCGTGFGKGQTCGMLIKEQVLAGVERHLWLSIASDLIDSAKRDWIAVGGKASDFIDLSSYKVDEPLPNRPGILYATHHTLRAGSRTRRRLDQILEWCGPDFDGVCIVDESHNLGNAAPGEEQEGSQMGAANLVLQAKTPKSRIVYLSATSLTHVWEVAYAPRLGLWGPGTAFPDRQAFILSMSESGTGALEVAAHHLKAQGLYFAPILSMENVTYERLEITLDDTEIAVYDQMASIWQTIYNELQQVLVTLCIREKTAAGLNKNLEGRTAAAAESAFWGAHQRFFGQLMLSFQTPAIIEHGRRKLAAGEAVVIQLTNTGEATLKRALAESKDKGAALEDLDLSPIRILTDMIQRIPVQQYVKKKSPSGQEYSVPLTRTVIGANGKPYEEPVQNPEAIAIRDRLLKGITRYRIPDGPLEQILDGFGAENVAEITGRKARVVRRIVQGVEKRVEEHRSPSANTLEKHAFFDDTKQVLVFSQAGGTGESYHADRRYKNRRKRNHYVAQAGWRANMAAQGLGRTMRTNQESEPHYVLPVIMNLKGQRRFTSTIARRLDTMGALTRGQRQAGGQGLFQSADNLETDYATAALHTLCFQVINGKLPGVPLDMFEKQLGLRLKNENGATPLSILPTIQRFLNRILNMHIATQNLVFGAFEDHHERIIRQAIDSGTFDHGIETIKPLRLVKTSDRILHTNPSTGATCRLLLMQRRDRSSRLNYTDVRKRYYGRIKIRFLADEMHHIVCHVPDDQIFDIERGCMVPTYVELRPDGTTVMRTGQDYRSPLPDELAEPRWGEAVAAIGEFVDRSFYVVSGALLDIWDKLRTEIPQIYRMQTTDTREALIGRVVSSDTVADLIASLDSNIEISHEDVETILKAGGRVYLHGDLSIAPIRVGGERRIAVTFPAHVRNPTTGRTQPVYDTHKLADALGLITEYAAGATRHLLRNGDLPALLAKHPPRLADNAAPAY